MRKRELEQKVEHLTEALQRLDTQYEIELQEVTTSFRRSLAQEQKDGGFVSLDPSATKRNRSWTDVEKNLQDCYAAWCVNPLAKSYCDYMRFFVIGKGTQITTEDGDEAQDRIRLFMEYNEWEILEKQICEELSRDGEVFIRYHDLTRDDLQSTVATLSLVDPLEIQAIDCKELNKPERYLRRYTELGNMDDNGNQTQTPQQEWIPAAEVHHIKINTSHNELRGRSDLLVVLPWLLQLKRWYEDMSRRNYYTGAINWDVLVRGGIKPSEITAKYPQGPPPGTVLAHTENEQWSVMASDMKWSDSTEGARAIKLMIMGAYKHPESWYGDTGESNLATTEALTIPTLRAFTDRQDFLKWHFEEIIKKGARVENVDVIFPELIQEEAAAKAQALSHLGTAFMNLQTIGLLSKGTMHKLLQQFVDDLDDWVDDESGVGEKQKIEMEEREEAIATAEGGRVQGQAGLVRPEIEEGPYPPVPPGQGRNFGAPPPVPARNERDRTGRAQSRANQAGTAQKR